MSAESGIKTFRDSGGLWEEYDVMQVASIDGWFQNPSLVMKFYNERRLQLKDCLPNEGHRTLVELEKYFDVSIVTQNVDDLHERAGSKNVLHLHGELTKVRSTANDRWVKDIGYSTIEMGDLAPDGHQLRPHIVWFGEAVPAIETAITLAQEADECLIIGTSLNVYPAAGLINYVPVGSQVTVIDPADVSTSRNVHHIKKVASEGMREFVAQLAK